MQFIYPAFLFGLLAVGIPILIHLFNFRRFKKVFFTNVKFLKEVKQQSQKQRNLKHLLVLAARILCIICLVLAFAQPYIPSQNKKAERGQKAISIYVDNSFSMNAVSEKGPLLESAKTKAREIASAYVESDKFQLLTNVFSGANDRFYSKEEFLQKLDEVEIDPTSKTLTEIIQKQSNFLANSGYKLKRAYVISDFQKSFSGNKAIKPQEGVEVNLIPLKSNTGQNLLIDSVWFSSPVFQPNQPLNLVVRIKNLGDVSLEGGTVALKLNSVQKSISGFDIAAGETKEVSLGFSVIGAGWQKAELVLTDHPIVFDDTYHFTFQVNNEVKVLALYQTIPNRFIQKLFSTEPFFVLDNVSVNQIDYSKLQNYDLIILSGATAISSGMSQELNNYLANGGNLSVFPDEINGGSGIDVFMEELGCSKFAGVKSAVTEVSRLDFQNELFANIVGNERQALDLPNVKKYFTFLPNSINPSIPIIKLRNGDVFLKAYSKGKGPIYQFAVNLSEEWSNFQQNQLFVPIMFRMAFMKKSEVPLAYTIGENDLLKPIAAIKNSLKPNILKKGNFEIMAEKVVRNNEIFLTENSQVKEAGLYELLDADSKQSLQAMAFNYNRSESDIVLLEPTEIKNLFSSEQVKVYDKTDIPINTLIKQEENGKPLWRLFIWLALLFIAIEILLLRFWKNKQPTPSPALS
jgi:preprotein translocase subunit SecG